MRRRYIDGEQPERVRMGNRFVEYYPKAGEICFGFTDKRFKDGTEFEDCVYFDVHRFRKNADALALIRAVLFEE